MAKNKNKSEQTGRSMVEMLGVLAVIGVLSVGGVVGYTTAMNKHKANEVMDALTERAVAISNQLTRNPTGTPDMGEFTGTIPGCENCAFTADNVAPEEGIFKINVSNLPRDICKQMLALVSENTLVRTVQPNSCDNESNTIDFYFTDDLSDDIIEVGSDISDYKTESDCETAGKYWCTDHCVNSSADCGPSCPSFASTSNTGSYTGGSFVVTSGVESLTCYCPTGYKYNDTNKNCGDAITKVCKSWTRNECGAGKYCQFTPNACTDGYTKIAAPTSGVCKDITLCGMGNVTGTSFRHFDRTDDCKPDWWTANAICAADGGRKMVSLKDVGCQNSKNKTCTSTILKSIRSGGFIGTFWTTDMKTEGDDASCVAWDVNTFLDLVGSNYYRNGHWTNALCK